MAIEAVLQLLPEPSKAHGIAGFSLRKISILSALQIPDNDIGTDTVLNMHPAISNKTKSLSQWWHFAISSATPDSDTWIEHCTGQIRVESAGRDIKPLASEGLHLRRNNMELWYEKFAEHGIGYGPSFRGLSNLKTHYRKQLASAEAALEPTKHTSSGESRYIIHPAALDTCLQLGLVASCSGQLENLKHVYVPVAIENVSVYLQNGARTVSRTGLAVAVSNRQGQRSICCDIQLLDESDTPLLQVRDLQCTLYKGVRDDTTSMEYTRVPYQRVYWKPDIESLGNEQARRMLPPVSKAEFAAPFVEKSELLASYLVIQVATSQKSVPHQEVPDYIESYLQWLQRCLARAQNKKWIAGFGALSDTSTRRTQVIDNLFCDLKDHVEVKLVKRLYDHLPAILAGEISSLQVALRDNLLTEFYSTSAIMSYAYPQLGRVLDLLAHKYPRMKIIEVGAGTGGATRFAMQTLCSDADAKRYKDYTFTDVSTSFFAHAQEEFSSHKNMVFKKLDIGIDPLDQGFVSEYDLVMASQSLHTTPTMTETIRNVRKLLRPGGRLLLLEITREANIIGFPFGLFPDYWNGASDGRIDTPFMSKEKWSELLAGNGFAGIDIVLDDLPEPISIVSTILATAVEPNLSPLVAEPSLSPPILIIHPDQMPVFGNTIARVLQERGANGVCVPMSDARVLHSSRVISLLDLDTSSLDSSNKGEFECAKDMILKAATLVWVSAGGLKSAQRPTAALIQGLMASVALERPGARYTVIDLDPDFDQDATAIAQAIIEKESVLATGPADTIDDTYYIMSEGCLQVSRMAPDRGLNEAFRLREGFSEETSMLPLNDQGAVELDLGEPGILDTVHFRPDETVIQCLSDDYVEVKVMAMGLNKSVCHQSNHSDNTDQFAQIINATSSVSEKSGFETEFAGLVQGLGNSVTDLEIGDRVWGFTHDYIGNIIRAPVTMIKKLPPAVSFEAIAASSIEHLAALYAFMHLSSMTEGDTALIDTGESALGIAALCIAKALGAEIYMVAATPEQADILTNQYQIPRENIALSREGSISQKIMEANSNSGVDVIIGTATTGDTDEICRCLAPMGRFIAIGSPNMHGSDNADFNILRVNASFSSFDVRSLIKQKPKLGPR